MTERRYTITEIDDMRDAIRWSYPSGVCYFEVERMKEIEERLRTYLIAGLDPKEVIDACNEKRQKDIEMWMEARRPSGGTTTS